jgi:CRISPR/Cas system-associated exonuclease Cas4 (RecB family)
MEKFQNQPAKSIRWNTNEERTNPEDASGSEDWKTAIEIAGLECSACGSIAHEVHNTSQAQGKIPYLDLGDYYIARTIDAMEEWHSKPRDGYHVSDVCLCPRLNVFRKIDRRPINAKTVSIYSAGKAIHEAIQWLFLSDKRTFEREKYVEFEDIQGSVDIYDRRRNIPLEFKTTRASDIKEPKSFHVDQLKYYMSMLGASNGYLIYQLLMHFGETPFKAFRITMNAQERKDQRDKLVKEVNSLKRAMEAGDPSLASSVYKDPSLNWLCKDCPYLMDCKKIQQGAAVAA